jgi:hypothetical protein
VHETVEPSAFLAVNFTVSPLTTVPADTAGVLSVVRSSEDDDPVSDDDNRSGADGVAEGVVSTVIVRPPVGPAVLPAVSTADVVIAQSPSASVPKSQLVTVGDLT